jgi:peroxiredoxin Q/BCP
MKAPDFSLQDQNGNVRSLNDYRGRWVVLYFYPKDDTPACTKEACGFRDNIEGFRKRGMVVIGISKDTVRSHKKFAEKYGLNFTLLSDRELLVIKEYGAWGRKKLFGREFDGVLRNTYLINPQGEIVKKYENFDSKTQMDELLRQ